MENKKNKKGLWSSIKSMFGSGFSGKKKQLDVFEEEEIKSPAKVVFQNFIHNRLAQIGIIGFVFIFSFTFIGAMIFPMDPLYNEPVLQNVGPGRNYLDYPSQLNEKGVKDIQSGATFSVALDSYGKVYTWGYDQNNQLNVPSELKGYKITKIAVGDRHALALTSSGKVLGWGYDNFQQNEMPFEISSQLHGKKVVNIFASDQYSAALTEDNKLYVWGSTLTSKLDIIPSEYQGHIVDADAAPSNMMLLMDDGSIKLIGVTGNALWENIPEELINGEVNVKQISLSYRNGMALDEDGELYVWGSSENNAMEVPKIDEKIIDIDGSRNSLFAVGESGKVYAWGSNALGETDIPSDVKNVSEIHADYFQIYAVNDDQKITSAWGNTGYLLGTDVQGRDVFVRLMHGGKVTLMVGVIAVLISAFIGLMVGMVSGFKGGWIDNLLMRLTEIITSIPFMPLVITLSAFIGSNMSSEQKMYLIMIILGFLSWPALARLVRSQILIEREKDFVLAARAMGIKEHNIIIRHILPNVISIALVDMTLSYAIMMLQEAALSFLGFGVQPPMPSWGNMLTAAQESTVIESYWWQWILPAVCVLIAALSVNLIGNALGDALDPKANEK